MYSHLLSIIIFLPVIGMFAVMITAGKNSKLIKSISIIISGLQVWLSLQVLADFLPSVNALQFTEHFKWLESLKIDYLIGIDGINIIFLLLTTIVMLTAFINSWRINQNVREYFLLMLLLDTGLTGFFLSFDLFLSLIFFGISLFPLYLLIGFWNQNSRDVASRYSLFTIFSFILIFTGFLLLFLFKGSSGFNIPDLVYNNQFTDTVQIIIFLVLTTGFLLILPSIPFHNWMINVCDELPIPLQMVIIGLFTKVGIFGLLRFCLPLLPKATAVLSVILAIIGLINMLYGSLAVFVRDDLKKILGYFTLTQTGVILLGLSSLGTGLTTQIQAAVTGISGGVFHTFNFGMSIILVLSIINFQEKFSPSTISPTAGHSPHFYGLTLVSLLILAGIPLFGTFISKLLCFTGAVMSPVIRIFALLAIPAVMLNLAAFFKLFQKLNAGNTKQVSDLGHHFELLIIYSLIIITLLLGIFPNLLLSRLTGTIEFLLKSLQPMI